MLAGERFLITRLAYNGSGNVEYMGQAAPGCTESEAAWLIKKITYDGSQNPVTIQFAGSQALFDQVWSDRASLSYG
ncbi:MAG: hypothetical protein HQL52_16185 [Magnetococcales bacterium]|nr:hypothetical protein [Magnetococcales bacterium]